MFIVVSSSHPKSLSRNLVVLTGDDGACREVDRRRDRDRRYKSRREDIANARNGVGKKASIRRYTIRQSNPKLGRPGP